MSVWGELLKSIQSVIKPTSDGNMAIMSHYHEKGHAGKLFMAVHRLADLDIATPFNFHILTPAAASGYVHLKVKIVPSAALTSVILFEGATKSGNGTALGSKNVLRDGPAGTEVLYHTPTTSVDGTTLLTIAVAAGKELKLPAIVDGVEECDLVLKAATSYLIRMTTVADNNTVDSSWMWYLEP